MKACTVLLRPQRIEGQPPRAHVSVIIHYHCLACGNEVRRGIDACRHCGAQLKWQEYKCPCCEAPLPGPLPLGRPA